MTAEMRWLALQVEALLEEMLRLCSCSQDYNAWIQDALNEKKSSGSLMSTSEEQKAFHAGPFNVLLRQLMAYYINMVRSPEQQSAQQFWMAAVKIAYFLAGDHKRC